MRFSTLAGLLLLAACSSLPSTMQPGDGSRLHVVLFWLQPDMPPAERAAMPVELAQKAARVPGLEAVWTGGPAGTPRPVADNSFDLLLVMRFRDAAAAKGWDDDPIHLELLARFKPWFARVVVYDGK
jgi:Stress responsive A/B Barrel Domain